MTMGIFITGLLAGLLFMFISWVFNKAGGQETKKIEEELTIGFSDIGLSIKEKLTISYLLMKIAECDGTLNKKEFAVMQAVMNILEYNPNSKEAETVGTELENYSVTELSSLLSSLETSQKEWFVKVIIKLMSSDQQINQHEIDFIQPILSILGITNEKYNEIKQRLLTS